MKLQKLLTGNKNKITVALLAVLGVLMIMISTLFGADTVNADEEYTDIGFYTEYLEKRICELCDSIYGVSEPKVFLTLDSSSEQIYQTDGISDFLILTNNDGEYAVKLCEIYPKVRGIAIVCGGGEIPRIQETVTDLLSAALGLPKNKIKVAGSTSGIN